jgi:uncharacterized damage-inducible protein DinB
MLSELIGSFEYTVDFIERQVADLSDEDIVLQPPGAPNHAAWTLGHVIFSCHEIAGELGVERWLPGDWESRFGYGSVPAAEASPQFEKAALLTSLREARTRLQDAMTGLDEQALASPLPDADAQTSFPTMGHVLLHVVAGHTAYHAGQLAAWRRAIGRAPVEVYV